MASGGLTSTNLISTDRRIEFHHVVKVVTVMRMKAVSSISVDITYVAIYYQILLCMQCETCTEYNRSNS